MDATPPDFIRTRLLLETREQNREVLRELAQLAGREHMTYARFTLDTKNGLVFMEAWKIQPTTPTPFHRSNMIVGHA